MDKKQFEKYLNLALSTGADFAELYHEKRINKNYNLLDSKLDRIDSGNTEGLGIRITKGRESYYASTDNLDSNNIEKTISNILKNIPKEESREVKLLDLVDKTKKVKVPHDEYPVEKKKEMLYKIDKVARDYSSLVNQVVVTITESDSSFTLANSEGKYIKSNAVLTRLMTTVYAEREGEKQRETVDIAGGKGYELFDDYDIEKETLKVSKTAVEKLDAVDFKGGELPVVIAPGFGAVIFHEACGHGLEATAVAPHLSVFSDDFGKQVATSKVTLIDDGTIPGAWGSSTIDDEGNATKKNILIDKGILKSYLVDSFNSKEMKMKSNGCGRRQNYKYATTSRMSNTYLAPGTDKIDDMIKSIKLGVFCEKLSGGSVNPATGDFNFAVDTARLIENGELKHMLKGITLIGNSKDILKNVEMVSDDLKISAGYCGSKSGTIPVTIGQPTIKVSKILVGGRE